ncbi:MAG: hypothetical protein IT160_00525 [Bryobacterales bacterium]|nr:hypothetical protein [Bryobacterales bacterium]
MFPAYLVRLRPVTPWRTGSDSGERDRTEVIYHSDALFSAVSWAMQRLGRLDEWLGATAGAPDEPRVRLSSCFPFSAGTLYFAPPRHLWPPAAGRQRWKGARFVPRVIVERLIAGKGIEEERWRVDASSQCLLAVDRRGVAPAPFRIAVRGAAAIDRLGSGSIASHSSACLEFAPDAGLWFVVVFSSPDARAEWGSTVTAALRLLADSGFGGGRSRGWGRAEVPEIEEGEFPAIVLPLGVSVPAASQQPAPAPDLTAGSVTAETAVAPEPEIATEPQPEPVDEMAAPDAETAVSGAEPTAQDAGQPEAAASGPEVETAGSEPGPGLTAASEPAAVVAPLMTPAPMPPAPPAAFWLLSLYSPAAADMVDWEQGSYSILERSGRVESSAGSGSLKQTARMVAEGSVVIASGDPRGVASNVAPEGHPHPVYRAGYAISIPVPWRVV